jgi:hypothetical protein
MHLSNGYALPPNLTMILIGIGNASSIIYRSHTDLSTDLMALHKEILDIQSSKLPIIHPGIVASRVLHALQGFNPFNILRHSFWIMLGMAFPILLILCLFPVICQIGMYQLFKLKADLHHIQLKNIKERRY